MQISVPAFFPWILFVAALTLAVCFIYGMMAGGRARVRTFTKEFM